MAIAGLAGATVASRPEFATAPVAAMFLGTALFTLPASLWMSRVGRRAGFIAGAALGTFGGVVAAAGLWAQSLVLVCVGTFLVGGYQGFAQFYRFAASEVAKPEFRPKAISYVLAGGIVAAVLGPLLGKWGGPLLSSEYAGSFLLLAATSLFATVLLTRLRIPAPRAAGHDGPAPRALAVIAAQPAYFVALLAAATGYGVMILAMTATPLAMLHHRHGLADATTVIQLHVLGMFLPSFFTGALIARLGVLRIMLAGVALLAGHVVVTLTGTGFYSFAAALILLGVGWNFLYVGGTTLLTTTYSASEKGAAQALNDLSIFVIALVCSLAAGALLRALGWQMLNAILLPWLAATALALVWLAGFERQNRLALRLKRFP